MMSTLLMMPRLPTVSRHTSIERRNTVRNSDHEGITHQKSDNVSINNQKRLILHTLHSDTYIHTLIQIVLYKESY